MRKTRLAAGRSASASLPFVVRAVPALDGLTQATASCTEELAISVTNSEADILALGAA